MQSCNTNSVLPKDHALVWSMWGKFSIIEPSIQPCISFALRFWSTCIDQAHCRHNCWPLGLAIEMINFYKHVHITTIHPLCGTSLLGVVCCAEFSVPIAAHTSSLVSVTLSSCDSHGHKMRDGGHTVTNTLIHNHIVLRLTDSM